MAISFEDLMKQMENQLMCDEAFVTDENNPKKILLSNPEKLLGRPLTQIELEMIQSIQETDDYFWSRSQAGGIKTGFPLFDQAIDGDLQSGLVLIAASPNVGKSAFMLQLLSQISEVNDNVFCEYFSLDDSKKEIIPRYIANHEMITIAQAKMPERFIDDEEIIERRNEGLKKLYRHIDRFSIRDDTESGPSIEKLEERIKLLMMTYPDKKIIIGIDSFYDLTTEKPFSNDKAMFEYIAQTLKNYTKLYDITIICTAHLRKTNGKRPINDDLKENNRLEFEANLICLLYNEVGLKEEAATVHWIDENEELKMPVLEVRFSKNKFSSFKGYRFYEMIPSQSRFIEADAETSKYYASLIYG